MHSITLLLTALLLETANAFKGGKGVLFHFANTTPYVLRVVQLGPNGENDSSRQHYVPPNGNVAMNGNYNGLETNVRSTHLPPTTTPQPLSLSG